VQLLKAVSDHKAHRSGLTAKLRQLPNNGVLGMPGMAGLGPMGPRLHPHVRLITIAHAECIASS
jgi:hypothetical protein